MQSQQLNATGIISNNTSTTRRVVNGRMVGSPPNRLGRTSPVRPGFLLTSSREEHVVPAPPPGWWALHHASVVSRSRLLWGYHATGQRHRPPIIVRPSPSTACGQGSAICGGMRVNAGEGSGSGAWQAAAGMAAWVQHTTAMPYVAPFARDD